MRKIVLLLTMFMAVSVVLAQTRTVTGKVVDESGVPIPYATITVKGANTGSSADANGFFQYR